MEYPLMERIGAPELLVGRKKEFADLHKWLRGVKKRASWSVALLGRKKTGKTAILQRLFNEDWPSASGMKMDRSSPFILSLKPIKFGCPIWQ